MSAIIVKDPGSAPEKQDSSTKDDALRKLIGCSFETIELRRDMPVDGQYVLDEDLIMIYAHQETARAAGWTSHILLHGVPIRGRVAILRRRPNSNNGFLPLTDADSKYAFAFLEERDVRAPVMTSPAPILTVSDEVDLRRAGYSIVEDAPDDLSAVLRAMAELEQRFRDMLRGVAPSPEYLSQNDARLEYSQLLSLVAAFNLIPHAYIKFAKRLGALRNDFAHKPGFSVGRPELEAIRATLPPENGDCDFVPFAMQETWDYESRSVSVESRTLRTFFMIALIRLTVEQAHQYLSSLADSLERLSLEVLSTTVPLAIALQATAAEAASLARPPLSDRARLERALKSLELLIGSSNLDLDSWALVVARASDAGFPVH